MKKILALAFAFLSVASLPGCIGTVVEGAGAAGGMYLTKPDELPPADTADQIPPHESWCYKTMGEEVECFAEPQDTPPTRLVNVDPANRYPLTRNGYAQVLEQDRIAHQPKQEVQEPTVLPMTPVPVQSAEITPVPKATPQAAPTSKAKVKHKKHKKKKKMAKTDSSGPCNCPTPSTATTPLLPAPTAPLPVVPTPAPPKAIPNPPAIAN